MGENAMDEPLDVIVLRFFLIGPLAEEKPGRPGTGRPLIGGENYENIGTLPAEK
jgi:hypothetical protein